MRRGCRERTGLARGIWSASGQAEAAGQGTGRATFTPLPRPNVAARSHPPGDRTLKGWHWHPRNVGRRRTRRGFFPAVKSPPFRLFRSFPGGLNLGFCPASPDLSSPTIAGGLGGKCFPFCRRGRVA